MVLYLGLDEIWIRGHLVCVKLETFVIFSSAVIEKQYRVSILKYSLVPVMFA